MFKSLSLKKKLLLSFSIVSLILVVVGATNYISLGKVVTDYKHVAEINLPKAVVLGSMNRNALTMRSITNQLGIPGITPQFKEESLKNYEQAIKDFKIQDGKYQSIEFVPGEREVYDVFVNNFNKFEALAKSLILLTQSGAPSDQEKFVSLIFTDFKKASYDYDIAFEELYGFHTDLESKKWVAQADTSASFGISLSLVLVFFGVGSAMIIGFILSQSLSSVLSRLASHLSDESDKVASVAGIISTASNSLSSSTTEQAAALQETVASIDEVSAMVHKNAENAKHSREKATACDSAVVKGKQTVDQVITAIGDISSSNNDIQKQMETSNQQLAEIVNVINDIATKTKVINDIVFQTKLLSFNASVEAARAGEHGKGFAVVAEEVGNLAEMSGNAAKEISSMLENSVHKVEVIVQESKAKVENLISVGKLKIDVGTKTAYECGQMLDEIVVLVREVNLMAGEISTASQEQSQGVSEINKAMSQMDQVTQMNASSSQETATSAQSLSGQADILKSMVQELLQTVQGHGKTQIKKVPRTSVSKVSRGADIISLHDHKPKAKEVPKPAPKPIVKSAPVKKIEKKDAPVVKMASGSDLMPSANDPRFEDV